jgi:hypothetical protein
VTSGAQACGTRCVGGLLNLLCRAGEEDLVGVRGDDAVEAELASVLASEFEEQAGAVAGLGVDDVYEVHERSAVEVGRVGDTLNGWLELAEAVVLRNDGDVAESCSRTRGVGGVDVGGGAAVAEGVGLELFVGQKDRWGRARGGSVGMRGCCCSLCCRGWGWGWRFGAR